MSMYKTIFVTEEISESKKIFSVDGSVELTTAFATLEEAVAAATGNNGSKPVVVVHKVASGKYEDFVVYSSEGTTVSDVTVVAVDFNGGEAMVNGEKVSVDASGLSADAQASILAELNDNNAANGKIFVAADVAPVNAPTLYVGVDAENNYVVGAGSTTITGSSSSDISSIIENIVNNNVQTITGTATPDLNTGSDAPSNDGAGTEITTPDTPVASDPKNVEGNMLITDDTDMTGANTVSGITKVLNDATLTVEKDATLSASKIAIGSDNYGSLNVGETDDLAKSGEMVIEGTVNNIVDGNGLNVNVDANGKLTVANGGKLNASQVAVEDGGVALGEGDSAGYLKVENGGELTAHFLKPFNGGVIDIEGNVGLEHSDPRQTLMQVMNGGTININAGGKVYIDGHNASVSAGGNLNVKGGELHVDLWEGRDVGGSLVNDGTVTVSNNGTLIVDNVFTNKTVFSADSAFITINKFVQSSTEAAVFNNSEISIADLDTGSAGYVIVGGASKVNIGNVYGGNALRLGKNAVILNGSKISGSVAARALGNVTFGETSTDEVTISRFDTKFIDGDTVTVNGTLTVDGYCFGMVGRKDYAELNLDGYGTIDLYQNLFLEGYQDANGYYTGDQANITVGENITINMLEKGYQGHLRFTYADVTVKGSIIAVGKDIDRALLDKANVTVTGSKGKLDIADDVWVGYNYVYDYRDEGKNNYKSTLSITDKAYFKVGDELRINTGSEVNVENAVVEANNVLNKGTLNITSADFTANKVSGNGSFNIGTSVDNEGNAIATKLQIGSLEQDVYVNKGSDKPVALTGSVNTTNFIRVYGDATVSDFGVNADYTGAMISGQGKFNVYGDTLITGNTVMNLNAFQTTNSGIIDSGVVINTANFNAFDMGAANDGTVVDAKFVVKGELNTNSFIVTNGYYSADGNDELVVAKDGVVSANYANGAGRYSLQAGKMTVYGYAYGNLDADGGYSNIGARGVSMNLTVDGTYASADSNNGKFIKVGDQRLWIIENSQLNVINGAEFSWEANVDNDGSITVDADSIFSAGSIVNTGMFNSDKAGEMVVLGDMTVTGNIDTDTLILKSGAVLEAGSLTVDNLTLSIGSTLALSGKSSTVESITVVGDIVPSNSEFTLITTGWDTILTATAGKPAISYKGHTYTVVDYDDSLQGLQFITVGSNLYVKDFGANVTGIYIGEISANTPGYVDANKNGIVDAGDKITDETGATYEVGKDAFTSIDEALASDALNEPGAADKVTSVIIDSDTKLSTIASKFVNIKEVDWTIGANDNITDSANFNGNLNLNNDGHLNATITISGDFTFTNTAKDTLVGEYAAYSITGINTGAMAGGYTADDKIVIDNTSGIIGADKGEAYFGGSQVEITGGDASNVTVNAGSLTLTDTTTFGLNADSTILAGKDNIWIPSDQTGKLGNIMVAGSANLSIDGDNSAIGANIENVDHTGTVTFNGNQTYTGDLAANKFVVAAGKDVTVNSNQFDFNELAIAGTLSTDFTSQDSFTKAGSITGAGNFNTTHNGTWVINDSVERDFSGFTGNISMTVDGASIVMGKGDAVANSTVSSYFSDDATVNIAAGQSVVLAKTGINTGIDFNGAGTINVGDYTNGAFAEQSEGFTQTLSGVNSGFTGTVNVSEGATLNLDSVIGATAINLDAPSTSATGAADATKLVLNVEDAAVNAKLTGDTNDIVDVTKNQKLNAAEALNNFHGTVDLKGNTLSLNAANSTDAQFVSADGTINANAAQIFSGDNSTFTGDLNIADDATVTLQGNMGATTIDLGSADKTGTATLNLDKADLSLKAVISGEADDVINVQKNAALETATALDNFHGEVQVNSSTLNLNGANDTDAVFTSDAEAGVINANADQTFRGDNSGFTGDLNVAEGKSVTLKSDMGAKNINLNKDADETDVTKLNLEHDGIVLGSVITGDANDEINVNESATLTGDNSNFKGNVTVKEGESLTLQGAMGAATIDLDKDSDDSAATVLNLEKENLTLGSVITGDANDEINANESATLTGDNSGFTGDINVAEGKTLTIENAMGAKSINLDRDADTAVTTLKLNSEDLALKAVITGDANDIVDVQKDATLETATALNNFHGEVKVNSSTLNLDGTNSTDAKFTGTASGVINANADQIFSGDNSGFKGDVNVDEGKSLTLKGDMGAANINLDAPSTAATGDVDATKLNLDKENIVIESKITGDENDQINVLQSATLSGDNTNFKGDLNIEEGVTLTLQNNIGADSIVLGPTEVPNPTTLVLDKDGLALNAEITGDSDDVIDVEKNASLEKDGALDKFSGIVDTNTGSTISLNGSNVTEAVFNGSGVVDVNAEQTLKGTDALTNFHGEVALEGNTINLNGANNTDAKFTSNANAGVINANADQTFSGDNSGFTGDLNIAEGATVTLKNDMGAATIDLGNGTATTAATLTLEKDALVLNSVISGDAADVINVKESVTLTANNENFDGIVNITDDKALTIQNNLGANTVNFGVSSDLNVTGNAVIDSQFVSTTGDTAAAVTISAGISATLSAMGALDNFNGSVTINNASSLILSGANDTAATIKGSGLIDANADQIFSGDVSGFSGLYDIASSVTLSGDLADIINAQGNTLVLDNDVKETVTINSTADGNLTNIDFGINDINLGTVDGDDFTNLTGTGTILDFSNDDQDYGNIKAGAINVNGLEDFLTIDNLTANINITVNGAQTDDKSDVTIEQVFTGNISVKLEDGNYVKNPYKLVTNSAFDENTTIELIVNGNTTDLKVDDMFIDEISKKAYLLQLKDNTLILTQVHQYSNYVAIDSSWSGKVPFQSVDDEGEERIIGYDAASKLDDAVGYIKGYDTGINTLAGTNKGDATMELMSGAYQLTTGTLMTDANGVTQLILKGRDGNNVIISGTLRGSDGRLAADGTPTELIIENVRTTGYVFGGGELTIKNSASIRTSGNAIAAGIANEDSSAALTMATDTTLTINGGYFSTSVLTGGSVAFGGDVEVLGDTSVVINNTTDETLTITGNIFGGSYAADGKVTQEGDAYVWVNATKATTLRGNIYVSGFQSGKAGAELTMTGDSTITFAGNAANLNFTGTVSAINNVATTESLVFANFNGKFNGSMIGFDTVVISGDSSLALGRRQTETADTKLAFTINGGTKANSAMYTVRDANAWEFSKQISIDTNGAMAGSYVIVDNYKGGFDTEFKFTVNGTTYDTYTDAGLKYENGKLVYEVTSKSNTIEVDVDAVLNGTLEATNGLNITGITKPTTDTFGVKAIAGDIVDSVLASAKIEGISSTNGIYQLTGADTAVSTDDVWAGLGVDASGDTLVVWGNTEQFVADTMTEFVNQDLTIGESYSVSTQVAPEDLFKEEYKKNNNGTLA